MDDDKIKYEDLISPDDSVKNLIEQLTELNKTYGAVLEVVKTGAKDIVAQLKSMSTATNEGRAEIDEATAAANRLARAQKELKFAMSDTGKEVAWLKSQTASQNKMSVEVQKASAALIGSYDKLKSELKDSIGLWKSLSEAERQGAFGQDLLNDIIATKQRISDLDSQLKVHVQSISAVEKAEQKLAFLRSAEGKRLMELKQLIADEIAANKTKKASLDEVAQAQERLRAAQAASRGQAYELNIQAREADRIAKLQTQFNLSEAGSYNQLAAQYELNKIKLNAMSAAERQAEGSGKRLEAETLALYVQMQKLQEATGNHRLSVGNYAKSWDGLGVSVSQVVRELPAAAVSMNTFFLGISNNIPILVDEINKLRAENKQAIAEGKQAKSVIGSIAKALFSWNTLLVIGLTVLSMHGKAIIDWISTVIKGGKAASSHTELLETMNKELENGAGSYGKNMVSLRRLSDEWKRLTTQKEQLQWIRDNKTEFDQLDISVRNVSDAENIFVNNTDAMITALQLRAKAAAAHAAAVKKYEEAFLKRQQAEVERQKKPSAGESALGALFLDPSWMPGSIAGQKGKSRAEVVHEANIAKLDRESKAAEADADALYKLGEARLKEAQDVLDAAGIKQKHKKDPKTPKARTRKPRDLTNIINQNSIIAQKEYEKSITALQKDEFAKRRKAAADEVQNENNKLREMLRKNDEYVKNVGGKYKKLTEGQKKQIAQQNAWINSTIANNLKILAVQLEQIEKEQAVNALHVRREALSGVDKVALTPQAGGTSTISTGVDIEYEVGEREKSIAKERALMTHWLDLEYNQVKDVNKKLLDEGDSHARSEEEITADYQKKQLELWSKYDQQIINIRERNIENQLELVKKGTEEELQLLLQQNEVRRQLALAENAAKPAAEQVSSSAINAQFNKRGAQIKGQTQMTNFDEAQAAAEAEFNIVKHNENQITIFKLKAEQDRWKQMVKLAKEGAIDWSDAQLKEAEATIKKLQRQIDEAGNFMNLIKDKGFGGALLTKLGFDDDQIAALSEATNVVLENIKAIADAEVEAAEQAVAAAEKRVEAAQSAYDAEVEGRNNGYANNVATAKKELQQEKKNQAQKEKLLEEAKRRQEAINTVIQASSLITASANLWSSFSSIPIIGPALAIAAIAAMWTSFAVAKVKAAQVTKAASQEYGEGGFEVLEGGSHASGNDIDLQTKNSKGKNMRAEGGEAMAIINKRSTRRYRRMLPALVDSINKGTFEEKFSRAFETGEQLSQNVTYQQQIVDLSQLEEDVKALKRNSEHQYYAMPDGSYIEKKRNVLRRMH